MKGIAYICVLLNAINVAMVACLIWQPRTRIGPMKHHTFRGSEFPLNLADTMKSHQSVLLAVEESNYYPLFGDQSLGSWTSVPPNGFGFVNIGPRDRVFSVAMFHELHCLVLFGAALRRSKLANRGHIQHCLGYLRNTALCASDLTLEPDDFTKRDFNADPVGQTHECMDWSAVYNAISPVVLGE